MGGIVDVSIKTPDGTRYSLEGPIDGEEGYRFLLQRRAALKEESGGRGNCNATTDDQLEICLQEIAE